MKNQKLMILIKVLVVIKLILFFVLRLGNFHFPVIFLNLIEIILTIILFFLFYKTIKIYLISGLLFLLQGVLLFINIDMIYIASTAVFFIIFFMYILLKSLQKKHHWSVLFSAILMGENMWLLYINSNALVG